MRTYEQMFGEKPSQKVYSPLEKGDHLELDDSELLDKSGIEQYQSLLGSLQWAISLGRFDIATAVITIYKFRQSLEEAICSVYATSVATWQKCKLKP